MMERTKWENGAHRMEFEPPDIYHIRANGLVRPHEAQQFVKILEEIIPQVPEVYAMIELSSDVSLPSETRKAVAGTKPLWKAVVTVGGNSLTRAAMNVLFRAFNLLNGSDAPARMVKTLEEAYAFFDEVRAANKRKAGRG